MKNRKLGIVVACVVMALAALILTGCNAATPVAATQSSKIFYPAPPDPPRLQFLMSFSDAAAWAGRPKESFSEFVVGKTKAETPKTELVNPFGLAARDGKLYVCDVAANCVHVIDFVNKAYSVLGSQNIVHPRSIRIGPDGTRYVCDMGQRLVLTFDANDKFLRSLGDPQRCQGPSDLAIYGDELFVLDQVGGRVEVWSKNGELKRTISGPGNGPEQLHPLGVGFLVVDSAGLVYVTDYFEPQTIKVFDQQGRMVRTIGEQGDVPGTFQFPKGIAVDSVNGLIYVVDSYFDTLQIFDLEGRLLLPVQEHQAENPLPQSIHSPTGIAIDATSIKAFQQYIDPDFKAEYLVFVSNEFAKNKIGVYAFGQSTRQPPAPMPAVVPTTQPHFVPHD